jgi:hypothetical protein
VDKNPKILQLEANLIRVSVLKDLLVQDRVKTTSFIRGANDGKVLPTDMVWMGEPDFTNALFGFVLRHRIEEEHSYMLVGR